MDGPSALGLLTSRVVAVQPPADLEARLFENAFLPRYSWWRAFFTSVVFHCVIVAIIVPLSRYLPESEQQTWRRQARLYQPLEIRLPESMYVASAPPPPERTVQRAKRQKVDAPKPAPKPGSGQEVSRAAALRTPPRRFELPPAPKRPNAEQTLLQAHLPPDLALNEQVKLPQMLFWASHNARLPKPAAKRFVEPGRKAPTVMSVDLDAPPTLDIPSQVTSNVRIVTALQATRRGLLHLPRPSTPIRVFQPPSPGSMKQGASFDILKGEPLNIIALNPNPALPKDQVVIPAGNQIGALPPPPAAGEVDSGPARISVAAAGDGTGVMVAPGGKEFGIGAGSGSGRGEGNGAGAGAGTRSGAGSGSGGTGTGSGAMAASRGMGSGGTGSGGVGAGGSGTGGAGSGLSGLGIRYSAPIRIEHPSNAVFDVVVMQSSAQDAFPESAGVLTGRPVYTVYLQVGAPKAWIMQYSVPKEVEQGPRMVGGVVYIGNPAPLKAPYPRVSVLPPVTMLPRTNYIMVHGYLDKSGQFKDLIVLRAPDSGVADLLLPQLHEWVFRPATRDGVPIQVEVLLAIPPEEV